MGADELAAVAAARIASFQDEHAAEAVAMAARKDREEMNLARGIGALAGTLFRAREEVYDRASTPPRDETLRRARDEHLLKDVRSSESS
jgi:hypothetical protein